jgi:transcriptional regulator of heat shock response
MEESKSHEKVVEVKRDDDADLLNEARKIKEWIEAKMNSEGFEEFKKENWENAKQIKQSLEKLVSDYDAEATPMKKLQLLIKYKFNKGW